MQIDCMALHLGCSFSGVLLQLEGLKTDFVLLVVVEYVGYDECVGSRRGCMFLRNLTAQVVLTSCISAHM